MNKVERKNKTFKIKMKDRNRFVKAVERLNKIMEDIRKYCPTAWYYVEGEGTFNLYDRNDSHWEGVPQEKAVEQVVAWHMDCGAW